jgi:uncharacterized protein (TIGR00369 family)
MPQLTNRTSVDDLNRASAGKLPGWLGLEVTSVEGGKLAGRLPVRPDLVAHTGYLLAGALLSCLDILCAYGVSSVWPEGASGFTTVEVKSNFVGTTLEGAVLFEAELLHGGRMTQVWDAKAHDETTGKLMAVFRCTQIILYPRA